MFEFLSYCGEYLNTFINIITIGIIIYYIYIFIKGMRLDKEFDEHNITSYSNLEYYNEEYKDTQICQLFTSLSERDKEYLYHLINAHRLKYKGEKPKVTKKVNNVKSQLFYNMLITFLVKQKTGAVIDSLKYNTLLNFVNT